MEYQVGDRVGDYEVVQVIGAGGMGQVYKVRNAVSERFEAMKVLLPNLEDDPELADRFLREIKVQAALEHPNLASLRTAQRVGKRVIMILEFVDGTSLDRMIASGPLPPVKAMDYIAQVLSVLAYAHARTVVHRDIKPSNIMVTTQGVVKLLDFGIAKMTESTKLTQTGRTLGSLYYMSPEQIKGAAVDARSDIYSLGVTLYELVTGRRPFLGDSDYSIMAGHLNNPPVPPLEINTSLPQALNDVILMAIAKAPEQRFQSADAFRNALLGVRASLEGPTLPMPVPKSGIGARGLYMALGSIVTIAVLVFVAIQVPKWIGTHAATETQTAAPVQAPAVAPTPTPAPDPAPPPKAELVPEPVAEPVKEAPRPQVKTAAPAAPAPPRPAPVEEQKPVATQVPAPAPTPAAAPPAVPMEPLRHRFELLATRANTARAALRRLESEQQRQGLGLRADAKNAESRMLLFMDNAEAALKAGNASSSKTNMDSAEREVERLEALLGI